MIWVDQQAASIEPGFERLLAAICEGRVGAVLAIESGTRLVIGEVLKSIERIAAWVQLQCAGGRVARKLRRKVGP